jgi:general secretion pathway protein D
VDGIMVVDRGRPVRRLAALGLMLFALTTCDQPAPQAVQPFVGPANSSPPSSANIPLGASGPTGPVLRPRSAPQTVIGTGGAVQPSSASPSPGRPGGGDISFNFSNLDVREVLRNVLGDQMNLPYVVDPKVQATITAQSGGPIPRSAVISTLENILRASGVALVQVNGVYRAMTLEDASKSGAATQATGNGAPAGFAVRVLPLKFVAAADLKSLLEPFMPPGGSIQVDSTRNIIVVSGPSADLDGFAELVRQFDVDWLASKSFGIYPLHVGQAKDVASDLQSLLQEAGSGSGSAGPSASIVRVVPVERLNAILVITTQPAYLRQVKAWIDRLDYGDDQTTPQAFEYRVQNSRAVDLARVLTQLFQSGDVRTVGPTTAPGTGMAHVFNNNNMGGSGSGLGQTSSPAGGGGLNPSATGLVTPASGTTTQTAAASPASANPGDANGAASLTDALAQGGAGERNELKLPPVRIVADEKNNALVIYARPRDYQMIEAVVRRLDVVPLQVMIEATIAEVTLNDQLQYGLQYFIKNGAQHEEFSNAASGNLTPADIAGSFPGFNYFFQTQHQDVLINFLRSVSTVTVLSAPELLVLDHQTAGLEVGAQVPIITQSAESVVTTGAPVVNSVDYRNTGVILQVTPRVNSSGLVSLDIDQEVSDVATTTSSSIDSPTINDRHIISSVVVKDGETIALGGLISENRNDSKNGIPVLDELPWVGPIFRSTNRSLGRTELLVMLTPRVIRNSREADAMTNDLLAGMRTIQPLGLKRR